jgi:ubiquitin conjugation factor E4 B
MAELVRWIPSHAVMAVHPVDPKKGNPGIFYEATEPAMRDVATALLTFLASPLHLHNPYLRGNLAKALQVYLPSRDHPARYLEDNSYAAARVPPKRRGVRYIRAPLHSILPTHPLAITALGPAVVAFHVDIAASGGHSSFYDKFSVRVATSDLLDYAYGLPQHKEALIAWAREGQPGAAAGAAASAGAGAGSASASVYSPYAKALRFASAVVDDLNHHMDEALKALREIREIERLKADAGSDGAWSRLTAAERTEKEQRLSAALGQARSWLYYAQGQLQLLGRLSDGGAGPSLSFLFLSDDLRDRLSANLGYYLDMLVNPGKRNEFRVADAAGIGFAPRDMLLELMTAYANLAAAAGPDVARLAASIVADERSYRRANWAEAASLASRFPAEFVDQYPHLPTVLAGWSRLGEAVVAAEAAAAAEAENLGELPDEVCDPITAGLMVDPVRLPSSGQVMDRGTIMTHLLGEERDPYNRSHLTADMLIPLPQVAAAVAAWRAARTSKDAEGEAAALARVRLLVDGDGSTPGEGVASKEEKERPAPATASATETASPSPAPSTAAPATATERFVAPQPLFESPAGARRHETAPPAAALRFGGGGDEEEDEEELQRALALSMDAAGPSGSRTDSRRSSAGGASAAAAGTEAALAPGASGGEDELGEDDDLAEAIRLSMQ